MRFCKLRYFCKRFNGSLLKIKLMCDKLKNTSETRYAKKYKKYFNCRERSTFNRIAINLFCKDHIWEGLLLRLVPRDCITDIMPIKMLMFACSRSQWQKARLKGSIAESEYLWIFYLSLKPSISSERIRLIFFGFFKSI